MKRISLFFSVLTVLVVVSGCKTTKSKSDIGPVKKFYQNTTSEFNGYFNANELLIESKATLSNSFQDNYNKILPVFKYLAADNPKAQAESLDFAVEKVTTVVNLHPASDWVDDCYQLMGEAQFIKQDFEAAEETFEFMVAEFSPSGLEKSKKRKSSNTKSKKEKQAEVKKKKKTKEKAVKEKKNTQADERKAKEKARNQYKKDYDRWKKAAAKAKKQGKKAPPKPINPSSKKKEEPKKEPTKEEKKDPKEDESTDSDVYNPTKGSISIGGTVDDFEQSDPENYFLKHRPSYQESILWLAKTYIERQNYTGADRLLSQLEASNQTYEDVRAEAAATRAHLLLSQKKYQEAIAPLNTAIDLASDKTSKARYAYIIAQLYQELGDIENTYAGFDRAIKFRPVYEMEFSAILAKLKAGWQTGSLTAESVKKTLAKMIKEEKNADYVDKVYYTLAEMALVAKDRKEAIKNLQLALNKSSQNKAQKTEAYLLMAQLYFEDESFIKSKNYYDSTLQVMNNLDERYTSTFRYASNLSAVAKSLRTINLQDSLLNIASMSEDEQRDVALAIKKKQDELKRAELLKKQAAANAAINPKLGGNGARPQLGGNTSSFYAYDDRAMKRGIRDFERVWGSRPLEDDWRRSERATGVENNIKISKKNNEGAITEEEIASILKNVPKSEKDIEIANKQIEKALFELGGAFRDKLENNKKAIETFETLLEKFPETEYRPEVMYNLYLAHSELGNMAQANKYKDILIKDYPNTTYARVLLDPDFVKNTMDVELQLNKYYDEAYNAMQRQKYQEAFTLIQNLPTDKFGKKNVLSPRFALLSAMCVGNLQGKAEYIKELKAVIGKHGNTPEATRAKEILRLLGEKTATGPGNKKESDKKEGAGRYTVDDDRLHYMVVVFNESVKLTDAKIKISDYHKKFNKLDKLRLSNIYLGTGEDKTALIVVRKFQNKAKAMEYFSTVQKNAGDYLEGYDYNIYPITQNNYRIILKEKNLDGYEEFFNANYK